jgi:hypothetical protein
MVVQDGVDKDESMDAELRTFGQMMSFEVFAGESLNFQLCDDRFNTLKSIFISGY